MWATDPVALSRTGLHSVIACRCRAGHADTAWAFSWRGFRAGPMARLCGQVHGPRAVGRRAGGAAPARGDEGGTRAMPGRAQGRAPGAVVVRADVSACLPGGRARLLEAGRGHPGSCPEVLDGTLSRAKSFAVGRHVDAVERMGRLGQASCTPAAGKAPARRARSGRIVARRPGTQGEGATVNDDANCPGANLSPRLRLTPTLRSSLPRRGVRIQHLARQRPAPGRRPSLGGRDPGGPVRSPSGVLQQCRASSRRPR
jgi:hypothetical protein